MTDEPHGERAVTHARIGNLLYDLRGTVDALIRLRNHSIGAPLVAGEEEELTAIRNNLDFLLSDILASRAPRLVRHG